MEGYQVDKKESESGRGKPHADDRECGHCHMRFSEFRQTGMLGCPRCYDEFEKEIDGVCGLLCATERHKGKQYTPRLAIMHKSGDLDRLKKDLDGAVLREEFELAALIRDSINQIAAKEIDEQRPCNP